MAVQKKRKGQRNYRDWKIRKLKIIERERERGKRK